MDAINAIDNFSPDMALFDNMVTFLLSDNISCQMTIATFRFSDLTILSFVTWKN
jgi:hypothetical protein